MQKKFSLFALCLMTVQLAYPEQPVTFFYTMREDIRAWLKGEAYDEQKERLMQQAGAIILAVSISLFCVAAIADICHGNRPPELRVGLPSSRPGDSPVRRRERQPLPPFSTSASMRDLFSAPTPPGAQVLRTSPAATNPLAPCARNMMPLPTESPGSPF